MLKIGSKIEILLFFLGQKPKFCKGEFWINTWQKIPKKSET